MIIESAHGHTYIDTDGKKWLDLLSGTQNTPLGHNHYSVLKALKDIRDSGIINTYSTSNRFRQGLLEALTLYHPEFDWQLCTTGSEAVERCLQMVKASSQEWHGRILYVDGGFHGKSYAVARTRYSNWGTGLLEPLNENSIQKPFDAIIYEPVSSMDGHINDEMTLRNIANDHNARLIADEMITGFGRCGPWFMSETADFIACGKGISSGAPIAFVASRIGPANIPTGWTTTSAGNALCSAMALSTLNELHRPKSIENPDIYWTLTSAIFGDSLQGKGALLCIRLRKNKLEEAQKLLLNNHIIVTYSTKYVRLAPRLNFPLEEFDNVMRKLYTILEDLLA